MKLHCAKCKEEKPIIVQPSGPHMRAICSTCKSYIKFLSKNEMKEFENEEDSK